MEKQNLQLTSKITALCMVILVAFVVMTMVESTYALNNIPVTTAWSLNLNLQSNNGTVVNSNQQAIFSPFDEIEITANLTSGNLTAPNTLVLFNAKGPSTSSFPTEIIRSSLTNNASSANITFRIPLEANEKNVLGTWQIYANVKTSNGTLQQKATFQIAWPIQVLSINFSNSKNQNQTLFTPGDEVQAILTFNANQGQTENIDITIQDATGKTINQTQLQNVSFNSTTPKQVIYGFRIPTDTTFGVATLSVKVFSGTYKDVEILSAKNVTAYFFVGTNNGSIPTPNPTPTPPPFIENSVSLFSWLLVATGFFTFTSLFLFLKRKPTKKIGNSMSNLPPTIPSIITVASENFGSTSAQTPMPQLPQTASNKLIQDPEIQTITERLIRISSAAKTIQAVKVFLKVEREKLEKDLTELNSTVDQHEKTINQDLDALREEIEKIRIKLTDSRGQNPQQRSTDKTQDQQ